LTLFCVFNTFSIWGKEIDGPRNSLLPGMENQADLRKNTMQVIPPPILIDPRNPVTVESGSLGVGLMLSKPICRPWVSYSLSGSRCKWKVRKPGVYAAKCFTGTIKSNVDIVIHFAGFADLKSGFKCGHQEMETYYSATILDLTIDQVEWHTASDFCEPENNIFIPENPMIETPWNLWNKISVTSDNSACKYRDHAKITFVMVNVKTWIDPALPTGQ
jgi:hypothetical protein